MIPMEENIKLLQDIINDLDGILTLVWDVFTEEELKMVDDMESNLNTVLQNLKDIEKGG